MFNSLSSLQIAEIVGLTATTIYHQVASYLDRKHTLPPGELITTADGKVRHLYVRGTGDITVVVDASLGGVEGYLLIEELAKLNRVCIYDRSGYGWSKISFQARTSQQIVDELHELLAIAQISPPYILVGDSFGSYNMRLYAYQFPSSVLGLVLTDGLHERSMLSLPLSMRLFKMFLTLSFGLVSIGAALGIVRLCGILGIFELIKPELKNFSNIDLKYVKRSFYSARHWFTMGQELWSLDTSGKQLKTANSLGELPMISIKSQTFLQPLFGLKFLSLSAADRVRDKIHTDLLQLSTNCRQIFAEKSSHFVWTDQPDLMIDAVRILLRRK
jgi:pimeloyl-ACP methyl ester carboxylesterase